MKLFKNYTQDQIMLLPPSLSELLPEKDLSRVVSQVVDGLDLSVLSLSFRGGGSPSYHPVMMLKVLVYAYSQNLYSSRKIAHALKRDVAYMWLSGMQRPDFNTINRFRSHYLKDALEEVFAEVLIFLLANNYIKNEDYFVDGTKIEANAGKYTQVWSKNTKRYKERVESRVREILAEIEEFNRIEDAEYDGEDLPEYGEKSSISSKDIDTVITSINDKLSSSKEKSHKERTSQVKKLKNLSEQLGKYEEQERILAGRNSYSKTDHDATFMRPKNNNDDIRPMYNLQMGSENGFVVGYSVHQNSNDATNFKKHMDFRGSLELPTPSRMIGDSIFGTEENYEYLQKRKIKNFLKYPEFHRELREEIKPFSKADFEYDQDDDCFICPADKELNLVDFSREVSKTGFQSKIKIYRCDDCAECSYRTECCNSPRGRTLNINQRLDKFKRQAKKNLTSEQGVALRRRRGNEIESVFGDIKHNQRFKRFNLRGLVKVKVETALLAISLNIRKLALLDSSQSFPA
jgi:transposase